MLKFFTYSVLSILTLTAQANDQVIYDMSDAIKVLSVTLTNDDRSFVLNRLLDANLIVKDAKTKIDHETALAPLDSAKEKIEHLISSTANTSDSHFLLSHKKIKQIINDLKIAIKEETK